MVIRAQGAILPFMIKPTAFTPTALTLALALLASACSPAAETSDADMTGAATSAQPSFTREEAQAQIWEKEQAIYADRGRGIIDTYIDNTAEDYSAWPPGFDVPLDVEVLRAAREGMAGKDQELLDLEFVSMSLNGDTAVIYYRSHRTRLPTGEPANELFEVVHVWVHNTGEWKLLGGLARDMSQ